MPVPTAQKIRFAAFELDRQTGELYKDGAKLKLQGQPIEVLTLLLEHPGELVTRERIRQHLWPEDTFVDFEHSLNTHIKKLRQVFDDDAETPRYIETLPRRGYRFIARVEAAPNGAEAIAEPAIPSPAKADEPGASRAISPSGTPPAPKPVLWKYVRAAALILVIAAAALYSFLRPRTPVVTAVHQLTRTGHSKGVWGDTANSNVYLGTDGTRVYFQEIADGKWKLAQVSRKGGEVSYLHTPLINDPALAGISGDGSALLVADVSHWAIDSPFWVLPLPDGPARRVPGAASWMWYLPGTDQIVYQHFPDLKPLFAAKLDGSEARPLMTLPADLGEYLALSPDGQRVRFATADGKSWESRLDGSGMHRFLPEFTAPNCCGYWSRNGKLFVFASPEGDVWNLWALAEPAWQLPGFKSRLTRLTSGPISFRASTPSNDGKQIFALGETPRGELSVVDPTSGLSGKYGDGLSAGFTDFSRDGHWMTYVSHPEGTLWRSRIDGSERMQLTFPPMGPVLNPRWSPDGRFIAFTEYLELKDGETKIYIVSPDGGAPLLLLSGDFRPDDPSWSPDGKSIAYGGAPEATTKKTEIRILNLESKKSEAVPGSHGLFGPRWSPNGQFLVAQSADLTQLFLYSFQSGAWKQLPAPKPPKGGFVGWQAWSHDGRYVYFMDGGYFMHGMDVYRARIPEGSVELVAKIANTDIICPVFAWGFWFGLTPDDRILVLRDRGVEELYALDLEYR